jgi:hypothetical protein
MVIKDNTDREYTIKEKKGEIGVGCKTIKTML